jgi:hypothetical protein
VEPLQYGVNEHSCIRTIIAVLETDDEFARHA